MNDEIKKSPKTRVLLRAAQKLDGQVAVDIAWPMRCKRRGTQ